MGRCDPGDQFFFKNSKCSESLQIKRECRPRRYEPNATCLGSNKCWEQEISRSVQNDKQVKKDVDCTVHTVHTDTDVAGHMTHGRPYDMWQADIWTVGM
jgi:hypothetical protein